MTRQPRNQHRSNRPQGDPALTSAQFHILLTLTQGPKHGYGIMQEVEELTEGALELGPGTLYRSIKQLLERGLIVEVDPESGGGNGSESRRRLYSLTPAGKARTVEEAQRLRELVRWAENAMVLEGGQA